MLSIQVFISDHTFSSAYFSGGGYAALRKAHKGGSEWSARTLERLVSGGRGNVRMAAARPRRCCCRELLLRPRMTQQRVAETLGRRFGRDATNDTSINAPCDVRVKSFVTQKGRCHKERQKRHLTSGQDNPATFCRGLPCFVILVSYVRHPSSASRQ